MRKFFFITLFFVVVSLGWAYLSHNGGFWHTDLLSRGYPVKGIDVSHHQGLIDWDQVADDGVSFAFLKATEGSGHVDSYYSFNWSEASRVGIRRGAYHFFSMESSGAAQGDFFISIVPRERLSLPPVIDLEVSLDYEPLQVRREVSAMSALLTKAYGLSPILYMDLNVYTRFYKEQPPNNPLWIREIYLHPNLMDSVEWTFWQYNNKGQIKGISGPVDLNVYRGKDLDILFND